ncbi:MAG: TIGR02266 family protein [Pseudomonadota bacterium]|nr:MAG: hypothetical protein DIU78_24345 [Pseudomonadota bacterium]
MSNVSTAHAHMIEERVGMPLELEESRGSPRVSVDLDVSLGSDHNFYTGFAENLSAEGVFVATHRVRPIGQSVEICIHLPDGSEVRAIGEVRWIRGPDAESATPPGMGVHFLELDTDSRAAMERFLAQRQPMLLDPQG